MERRAIEDLFRPFGPVTIKSMFGGRGIYAGEMMFALEAYGEIYLKSDAQNVARFDAAVLRPFAFDSKRGRMVTSYRLLPEEGHEDDRVLKEWCVLGMEAARRAAAAKKPAAKPNASAKTAAKNPARTPTKTRTPSGPR